MKDFREEYYISENSFGNSNGKVVHWPSCSFLKDIDIEYLMFDEAYTFNDFIGQDCCYTELQQQDTSQVRITALD